MNLFLSWTFIHIDSMIKADYPLQHLLHFHHWIFHQPAQKKIEVAFFLQASLCEHVEEKRLIDILSPFLDGEVPAYALVFSTQSSFVCSSLSASLVLLIE